MRPAKDFLRHRSGETEDATIADIAQNNYRLSIPLYVTDGETTDEINLDEAISEWVERSEAAMNSHNILASMISGGEEDAEV